MRRLAHDFTTQRTELRRHHPRKFIQSLQYSRASRRKSHGSMRAAFQTAVCVTDILYLLRQRQHLVCHLEHTHPRRRFYQRYDKWRQRSTTRQTGTAPTTSSQDIQVRLLERNDDADALAVATGYGNSAWALPLTQSPAVPYKRNYASGLTANNLGFLTVV